MKTSYYNFIYPMKKDDTQFVVYNSFTNAMALMDKNEIDYITKGKEGLNAVNEDVKQTMVENGFIVDDNIDELELIRERMFRCRYDDRQLGITIAPTLDCNFRCVYCYEKECEKGVLMSESVCKDLVEYVSCRVKDIHGLSVAWYGGEPLLAIKVIESLSKEFINICNENNITYNAAIVTNGYLLDEQMIERIMACNVSFAQITLDGDREGHNARRPHANGCDTFDTIIQNIIKASKKINVAVRVNVDKKNMDAAEKVEKILNMDGQNSILVYPAPIQNEDGCYNQNECIGNEEFYRFKQSFYSTLKNKQFIMSQYPRLIGNSCCADNSASLVVAPNGDLFKCWTDIGKKEYCIGNLSEKRFDVFKSIRYIKYDATRDEKCRDCKFLPICMGGCPRDVADKKADRCIHVSDVHRAYITQIASVLNDVKEE